MEQRIDHRIELCIERRAELCTERRTELRDAGNVAAFFYSSLSARLPARLSPDPWTCESWNMDWRHPKWRGVAV